MHRGELSIGRAFSGFSLTGAIGALIMPALIALLLIQLAGHDGRSPLADQAGPAGAPQTAVSGSQDGGED